MVLTVIAEVALAVAADGACVNVSGTGPAVCDHAHAAAGCWGWWR